MMVFNPFGVVAKKSSCCDAIKTNFSVNTLKLKNINWKICPAYNGHEYSSELRSGFSNSNFNNRSVLGFLSIFVSSIMPPSNKNSCAGRYSTNKSKNKTDYYASIHFFDAPFTGDLKCGNSNSTCDCERHDIDLKHPYPLSQELSKPAHGFLGARTSCSCRLPQVLAVWASFLSVSLVSFLMRLQSISVIAGCLSFNACKRIKKGIECFYFCPYATGDSTGERNLFC